MGGSAGGWMGSVLVGVRVGGWVVRACGGSGCIGGCVGRRVCGWVVPLWVANPASAVHGRHWKPTVEMPNATLPPAPSGPPPRRAAGS